MTETASARNTARHTIRTVSLGTMLRLLRLPFMLLSMVFIPRAMQPEVYGRYALLISVYFMADVLTDMGILQVFGRFIPGPDTPAVERQRTFLLQGFLATGVALAGLACLLMVLFVGLVPQTSFPAEWLLPFCLLLIVTRIEGILFGFLYGMNQIVRYSLREFLRSLLLFAGVWLAFRYYGLRGAVWSLVGKELILGLIALHWTWRYLFQRCRPSWSKLKTFVAFGFSFYIPLLLFGFLQRAGAILIQAISKSAEQVGYYDIANQFFLLCVGSLGVILVTLLPSMSAYREADANDVIHRWHGNIMSYCGVVVFLIFNALAWCGAPVLAASLGPGFLPVRNLALIMILAMAPGLIAYVGVNYAILDKEPRVYALGVFAGLAAMAATSLALIPFWLSTGAAWGTVAGHTVLALFFCWRYREHFKLVLKGFLRAMLIGVLFLPAVWIQVEWFWAVVMFAVTTGLYLTIVLVAGVLDVALLRHYMLKGWSFFRRGGRECA